MIVISNAFVYSTCSLVVVSRYGYIISHKKKEESFSRTPYTNRISFKKPTITPVRFCAAVVISIYLLNNDMMLSDSSKEFSHRFML